MHPTLSSPSYRAVVARLLPALIILTLILSAQELPAGARPANLAQPTSGTPRVTTASDSALSKVDPQLLREAKRSVTGVGVIIVSQGTIGDKRGLSGITERRPDPTGLVFTEAHAHAETLAQVASAPNVVVVLSDTPPQVSPLPDPALAKPVSGRPFPRSGEAPHAETKNLSRSRPLPGAGNTAAASQSPDSWHTPDIHNVRQAWQEGYRGGGVKVAVLDSGIDFGHPDLQNTFARVDDPRSPYYGWPYVVDPYSIELLSLGITHDIPEAIKGYGSWFVDTSTTVSGAQAQFTTVTANASGMDPVTHTYILPGTSLSGTYHIGIHPDEHLAFDVYGEYPAVLVADTVTAGVYNTVYVDLNNNHDFRDDAPMRRGSEVATLDTNHDGQADLSAGMLYFIADGRLPVPASDWLYGLLPPDNGSLVALFGSMDYGEDHGTACASSVVAQGRVDGDTPLRPAYKPAGIGGMVRGMAPEAKVVGIGNIYRSGMAIYNAMLLSTLGLDGQPGTGDEPQIASMSFGFSGGWNNGWDFMSRYLLYLSQYNPKLAWLAAAGNGGPGYGTVTPPATSPAAIAVGASTQYGETTTFEPISSTDRITWGDVQPWSNRGPSHLGQPKPDFVAVGAWGTCDVPVNMVRDGSTAYDIWGGTSMSTPVSAGIAALVYEAYRRAHGTWPDAETVRQLLKSSAVSLNYDAFTQGAGMLDAWAAVRMSAGQEGVSVEPSSWVPGSSAPGYMGALQAGGSTEDTFSLQNRGTSPVQARVYPEQVVQASEYEWSVTISNAQESRPNFTRPDYLWNLTSHVPADTDLVRVSAVISYTDFSHSDPRSPFLGAGSDWRVLAYDWHDSNHDGAAWRDLNNNGVVNAGEDEPGESNRLTYGYNTHDIVSINVQNPLQRSHDGFLVGLQHQVATSTIPTSTVHLKLTTYRRQAWPAVTAPSGSFTVGPGQTYRVQVQAHADAAMQAGSYEGSLVVETGSGSTLKRTLVPIALNVQAGEMPLALGGANRPAQDTIFDNGRVTGEQNWRWRPESGEWRHYFFSNNSQPQADTFLWASVSWSNFPTDFDLVLGGPSPGDFFSQQAPQLFGPNGMDAVGGSEWTNLGGGDWQWRTTTDTTEEWVGGRLLQPGAHEAVLHNVFYSGLQQSEPFTATLGTVRVSSSDLSISAPGSSGSTVLTMTTDVDLPGVRAAAYGLAQRQTWPNISIEPMHTWFTDTTLNALAAVEFSTEAEPGTNVDLYVDHWENGRYVWVASSTSPSGNEFVRIEPAPQGNYRVRVEAARDVPSPARFTYSLKAIGGTDMSVTPSEITGTVRAGTTLTFTVGYNRPGIPDGTWEGRLFLGPWKAPSLMSIPVTVIKGNITPTPSPTPQVCRSLFTDVPPVYWAHPYIDELYCRGIVSGYLDRTFRPGGYASRVQLTKMLVLGMGWPLVHPTTTTFSDVPELSWGYEYIETALRHGAVSGYADGTFRPSNPVTRGQLTKMLVISEGWTLLDPVQPTFTDIARGSAFYAYVETAAAHGVVSGYADRTFRPGWGATRAQLSKMLVVAMGAP